MKHVEFRFYEELNDFLPKNIRKVIFRHQFSARLKVGEVIERLGVPLGRLAKYLRIFGFDTVFDKLDDEKIIIVLPNFQTTERDTKLC